MKSFPDPWLSSQLSMTDGFSGQAQRGAVRAGWKPPAATPSFCTHREEDIGVGGHLHGSAGAAWSVWSASAVHRRAPGFMGGSTTLSRWLCWPTEETGSKEGPQTGHCLQLHQARLRASLPASLPIPKGTGGTDPNADIPERLFSLRGPSL